MGSGVKWLFELFDKVSPPAKTMAKSLDQVDKVVEKLEKSAKHTEGALKSFGHHIDEANKKAGKEALEGLAGKFAALNIGLGLAEKVVEKVAEIGAELLKDGVAAANFGRESKIVFSALLGGAEKGNEAVEYLEEFAAKAGISIDKSRDLVNVLTRGGFEGKNLNVVMNAAVDVEALSLGKVQAQQFAEAFTDIQTRGELSARMLTQFQSILGEEGFDKLAKKLGFATHGFHALQKQLEETPVGARKAEQALLDVVQEVSGGKLGATQAKLAKELPGLWTTIGDRIHQTLSRIGESPAWDKLLAIVDKLAAALDPNSASGKSFGKSLERVLDGVDDFFSKLSEPGAVDGIITKMVQFADSAATVAQAVISITEALAKVIGWWNDVPGPLRSFLSNPLTAAPRAVGDWLGGVVGRGGAASYDPSLYGHSDKYYESLRKNGGEDEDSMMSVGANAGEGLKQGVEQSLDIHSPSRVMYELGANAGEGLRRGVSDSTGSSSGPAQLLVNLTVVVQGGAGDAEEQGRLAGRAALAELQPAFDTLAEMLG